jgi:SEC-C motif-containing protein
LRLRRWSNKPINNKTTTPPKISEQIIGLCRRLDPSQEPLYIPVKPWRGGRVDNCFYNVEDKTKADGGQVQYGWTIWENAGLLIEAEFHAVWVSPATELIDITEKADGEKQILFLPDSNRVWQREMMDNIRVPLIDNDYTRQLVRHGEAMFNLRRKYWDRQTGISRIPLQALRHYGQQGLLGYSPRDAVPTQKIGRNQPCPCGSGKKHKKCHGS